MQKNLNMNIQYRKLHFIQEFIRLADINLLNKFEKMLKEEREKMFEAEIKPMTMKQYEQRVDSAIDDFKNNRVTTGRKLKKDIATWK